jgi:Na+-driven multidrug efflux pump
MSFAQGLLFIPVIVVANLLFGLTGIIWAMTATELLTFAVGLVLWAVERPTRRVATEEQAAAALAMVEQPA